jgi:hypothetical protein
MMTVANERVLGTLDFSWADETPVHCECDRLAVSLKAELLLASLLMPSSARKKLGKMITDGVNKLRINGSGFDVVAKDKGRRRPPGQMTASPDGYTMHHYRLGFNLEHVMLITKNPSFLVVNSPAALWRELTSVRYTTPLLEEWLPYLRQTMIDGCYLENALCHECDCGLLKLGNTDLDAIVIHGLKKGKIKI